jgi:hypothetical protein
MTQAMKEDAALDEATQLTFTEDLNGVWLQGMPDVFRLPMQSLAALKQKHSFILWNGNQLTINAANGRAHYSLASADGLSLTATLIDWSASGRRKA